MGPPQAAPVEAAPAAADTAPPETTGLQDIVVTATKRETNLQKTPISISVLGSEQLKQRHVQSLIDLADGAVPSLRIATFEARQSALTIGIRGIVPGDANQPAREQGVGVYLDGVYLGRQHGLNASLFDVERIEVLKGPQGTLFGRNTEGGALSIVTKAPTGEFGGRATAGFGNYGSYNGALHLDLPSFANIAVKLDGVIQHQGPTTTNPLAGQAGFNQYHRYGGRVSALWKPIDGLSVNLSFDKSRDENTPFYSQLITVSPAGLANLPAIVDYGRGRASAADITAPAARARAR
jgi:iron complex outermembrane receptor protein